LWPTLDYTAAGRAQVPPHGQSGGVTLKIGVGKTVPPQMALLAARAYRRFLPGKISTKDADLLEIYGDK
jgi:hypothetical protein